MREKLVDNCCLHMIPAVFIVILFENTDQSLSFSIFPFFFFMCLSSLSLKPFISSFFPHPLFYSFRKMLATVSSERLDLATWTRPWNI